MKTHTTAVMRPLFVCGSLAHHRTAACCPHDLSSTLLFIVSSLEILSTLVIGMFLIISESGHVNFSSMFLNVSP